MSMFQPQPNWVNPELSLLKIKIDEYVSGDKFKRSLQDQINKFSQNGGSIRLSDMASLYSGIRALSYEKGGDYKVALSNPYNHEMEMRPLTLGELELVTYTEAKIISSFLEELGKRNENVFTYRTESVQDHESGIERKELIFIGANPNIANNIEVIKSRTGSVISARSLTPNASYHHQINSIIGMVLTQYGELHAQQVAQLLTSPHDNIPELIEQIRLFHLLFQQYKAIHGHLIYVLPHGVTENPVDQRANQRVTVGEGNSIKNFYFHTDSASSFSYLPTQSDYNDGKYNLMECIEAMGHARLHRGLDLGLRQSKVYIDNTQKVVSPISDFATPIGNHFDYINSFEELGAYLDKIAGVEGNKKFYSNHILKNQIEQFKKGKLDMGQLTNAYHFRKCVVRLLVKEKSK